MIGITINTRKLQKGLGKVSVAINPNSLMPILKSVLVAAKGEHLVFTGTDMQTTIRRTISSSFEGEGSFCIDAKLLWI